MIGRKTAFGWNHVLFQGRNASEVSGGAPSVGLVCLPRVGLTVSWWSITHTVTPLRTRVGGQEGKERTQTRVQETCVKEVGPRRLPGRVCS